MPVNIVCPSCKVTLAVPDSFIGKTVRCSGCKDTFTVPDEAVPVIDLAEEPREDDRTRSRRDEDDRDRSRRDDERRSRGDDDDRDRRSRRYDDDDDDRRRDRRDDDYDRPRRRSGGRQDSFDNLGDDDDRGMTRRRRRSSGGGWQWSWNPLIGIMYGPIPVGLVILAVILVAIGGVALLGNIGRRRF
jgi:predicted Zn finger-like uncharacterized protein